jgi:cell division protein FtsW (lipid II flippase)
LPFLSYGGSSMFAQCLGIGLLLAVHRHTRSLP